MNPRDPETNEKPRRLLKHLLFLLLILSGLFGAGLVGFILFFFLDLALFGLFLFHVLFDFLLLLVVFDGQSGEGFVYAVAEISLQHLIEELGKQGNLQTRRELYNLS